jgi:rubrerythrin
MAFDLFGEQTQQPRSDTPFALGGSTMSVSLAEKTATVLNLMSAFEAESNTHAKYLAFADRADSDGWHGTASLFRAIARAEQIHAHNHARALKRLEVEAHCELHPVAVKSTLQNLKIALAGEQHEIDTMYPPFLEDARAANANSAIRSCTWAMEAERAHARLFREAIELVEEGLDYDWVGTAQDFLVCAACGYTPELPETEECCPLCNLPREKFEVIR